MRTSLKWLAGLTAVALIGPAPASAGGWKYGEDARGNSELTYTEDGKATFFLGCGHALGLHVKYPGKARKDGKASITIASATNSMNFRGEFEEPSDDMATDFLQFDLGYRRQDPELYGNRWKAQLSRLLDLLGSGTPLTISAGKDSYRLPPNDAANWRAPFEACG